MTKLTIITPTYNRAHTLKRCFDSLLKQTCKDFEWIIVDDGSKDDTQDVIAGFCTDEFPVIKIKKENGGKHTALNAAHPHIHGEYVLILDSDDYLIDTAVEEVLSAWGRYKDNEIVGVVTFLKGNEDREPVCTVDDYEKPVAILHYRRHCHTGNDCCEVIRSKLFLQYPFPEYEGERFISECALWNRVDLNHKCVYVNSVVYICEYLEDGLTNSGRAMRIRNPRGGMFISNLRMGKNNFFSQRLKYGLLYTCYGFFAKKSINKQINEADHSLIAAICCPFGFMLYLFWNSRL